MIEIEASLFPGSRAGTRSELRINVVLHINSVLEPDTVVPIGWIAAGKPARLFSPDRHEDLWAVQESLDFLGTVYWVASRDLDARHHAAPCAAYGPGSQGEAASGSN